MAPQALPAARRHRAGASTAALSAPESAPGQYQGGCVDAAACRWQASALAVPCQIAAIAPDRCYPQETMKSDLAILYHREPHDETVENGIVRHVAKKSPNGIVPTLKSSFGNANRGTWIAWKQGNNKQQTKFQQRVAIEDENYEVCRIPLSADQVKHFHHITSQRSHE